ncbi:MAG: hypothetical protein EBY80_12330 [Actinobacteria bacterium]|nr:hypothetical protein [Actinomycetota bacterium]
MVQTFQQLSNFHQYTDKVLMLKHLNTYRLQLEFLQLLMDLEFLFQQIVCFLLFQSGQCLQKQL